MNKTLREHINEHPDIQTGKAIAITWDTDDLLQLEQAPEQKYPINEREATEILKRVEANHDPSFGITWEDLEHAISDYLLDHPRSITRAEVAIGNHYGGGHSGSWTSMHIELPTHTLEGLTNQELITEFERAATLELDSRNEECAFVRTLSWETIDPDGEGEGSDA